MHNVVKELLFCSYCVFVNKNEVKKKQTSMQFAIRLHNLRGYSR